MALGSAMVAETESACGHLDHAAVVLDAEPAPRHVDDRNKSGTLSAIRLCLKHASAALSPTDKLLSQSTSWSTSAGHYNLRAICHGQERPTRHSQRDSGGGTRGGEGGGMLRPITPRPSTHGWCEDRGVCRQRRRPHRTDRTAISLGFFFACHPRDAADFIR